MQKKKVITVLLILTLLLTACGNGAAAASDAGDSTQSSGIMDSIAAESERETEQTVIETMETGKEDSAVDIFLEEEQKILEHIEDVLNDEDIFFDGDRYSDYLGMAIAFVDSLDKSQFYENSAGIGGGVQMKIEPSSLFQNVEMWSLGYRQTEAEIIESNHYRISAFGDNAENIIPMSEINGFRNTKEALYTYEGFCEFFEYAGKPVQVITYMEDREFYSRLTMFVYDLGDYGLTITVNSGYSEKYYDGTPFRYIRKVSLYEKEVFQRKVLESLERITADGHDTVPKTKLIESDYWSVEY